MKNARSCKDIALFGQRFSLREFLSLISIFILPFSSCVTFSQCDFLKVPSFSTIIILVHIKWFVSVEGGRVYLSKWYSPLSFPSDACISRICSEQLHLFCLCVVLGAGGPLAHFLVPLVCQRFHLDSAVQQVLKRHEQKNVRQFHFLQGDRIQNCMRFPTCECPIPTIWSLSESQF